MESKNYIQGKNKAVSKVILTFSIAIFLFVSAISVICIWSYHSCIRAGVVTDIGKNGIITWIGYAFITPLCSFDWQCIVFIIKHSYVVLLADVISITAFIIAVLTQKGNFKGVEHGSSHWATNSELQPFRNKSNNMPLADGIYLTPEAEPANRNVFVLSPPGGGKSFRVMIPAIEALTRPDTEQGSFFCTDTKGALYRDTAKMVRERGVKTYLLNLSNPWFSHRYNPLDNIHEDKKVTEIAALAQAYARNVRDEEAGVGDSIWEDTFKQLLTAVWLYQSEFKINPLNNREESRAMWRTTELIQSISGGQGINPNGEFARIVEKIRETSPLHAVVRNFDFIATGAGETVQSVIITAGSKIYPFTYPEIESLTRKSDIVIDKLFEEPSAVYLNFEVGAPYKAIAALFMEQLFSSAYYVAENKYSGKLPRPFKFFLDELPNICTVDNLPKRAATCRSYNIDLVISVQSMQQLQKMFKDAEKTLMNNCVTHIYLGSGETDALKNISEALGKTTTEEISHSKNKGMNAQNGGSDSERSLGREIALPSEIYSMPNKYAIVRMQNHQPMFAEKFKTEKQDWYKLLGGIGAPENNCDINKDFADLALIYKAEYLEEWQKRNENKIKESHNE